MLANFFNKSKPAAQASVVLLFIGFYTVATFKVFALPFSLTFIFKNTLFFGWHVLFLIIFNFIIIKNKLTKDNLFALFISVLLLSAFYKSLFNQQTVLANLALILGLRKNYSFRSGFKMEAKQFDFGFWVGVAVLFYSWSILFLILGFVSLVIYKKLTLKNLIIQIIGVLTPAFLFFTYCFYFDKMSVFYNVMYKTPSFLFGIYNSWQLLIPFTVLIAVLLWSVFSMTSKIATTSIKLKQNRSVLLINLLTGITVLLLAPVKDGSEVIFIVFPTSILIANFLENRFSDNFKNMILYLFLAVSIFVFFL